ncbi:phage protease [Coraliomargarita algicola]|uniref:Phage protease n=1 Tax=Coraliomargarita algicola TaxID=3092156 RepID=A0ABZ0RGF6_9BACT|nr:phage protease [Coraliomargarita sp. J2-16]WPJ95250.1 phage protease [Coraliomargarita sp. J2-16]
MPEAIKAALSTELVINHQSSAMTEVPQELQYMPPGTHRINASREGKPVALDVTVDAVTAETLNTFLQNQLTKSTEGIDDRPFFDFNHEDREAAAWPTEFYWAGDDPKTGGVRAKIEWSGAGQSAVKEKTFRRFSPTFIPDDQGKVIGSETNMGGLVNRAAFKSIQSLFAKGNPGSQVSEPASSVSVSIMKITAKLHALKIIDSVEASEDVMAQAIEDKFTELETENRELKNRIEDAIKARATSQVEAALKAGRLAPADTDAKAFWQEALIRDEAKAVKALEALPINPVLAKVTEGDDPKNGLLDKMHLQQKKLAEVRAANPQADFQTVFAKAQSESPDLFR